MTTKSTWDDQDLYQMLGILPSASAQDITSAYRVLARQLHPDAHPGDPEAAERFRVVSMAYEILGHENARRDYDSTKLQRDLFNFENGASIGVDAAKSTRAEVDQTLRLSFVEAIFGTTTDVPLSGGTFAHVRIPAGVKDGQRVRLPGRSGLGGYGSGSAGSGPAGSGSAGSGHSGRSLIIQVVPHPVFSRKGDNLLVTMQVSYPELVLGADIDIPKLEGDDIPVSLPAGTPSGAVIRLKGLGVPRVQGGRGDLLVTFELSVPRQVTPKERKALQSLEKAMPARSHPHGRNPSSPRGSVLRRRHPAALVG